MTRKMTDEERRKRREERLAMRRLERLKEAIDAAIDAPHLTEDDRAVLLKRFRKRLVDFYRERALKGAMDNNPELKALCLSPAGYNPLAVLDFISRDPKTPGHVRLEAAFEVSKHRGPKTTKQ